MAKDRMNLKYDIRKENRNLVELVREKIKKQVEEETVIDILNEVFAVEKDELPNGTIHGFESDDLFDD